MVGVVGVSVELPLLGWVPVQALDAVQAVALVDNQVMVDTCPRVMALGLAAIVTVGSGGAALTVSEAIAEALPPDPVQLSVNTFVPTDVGVLVDEPLVAHSRTKRRSLCTPWRSWNST